MHEKRSRHSFTVTSICRAHNKKTFIAKGVCESCGFGMAKIIPHEAAMKILDENSKFAEGENWHAVMMEKLKEKKEAHEELELKVVEEE